MIRHSNCSGLLRFLIPPYLMHADHLKELMKCLSQRPRSAKSQEVQHWQSHRGERLPVRCSVAHEDTSSSASKQAVGPGDAAVSRRHAVLAATCACIAARCAPAKAAIIDEAQAQEIFEQVSDSVVSIANVKQTGERGCWCIACDASVALLLSHVGLHMML